MDEKHRRSRTQIDYALMVSGKSRGLASEELVPSKQKKFSFNRMKKAKPVKIKLRRSLPGVLNENKQLHLADQKNSYLRTISLNQKMTNSVKSTSPSDRRCSIPVVNRLINGFPSLPIEITKNVVDFSIPQEMIDESNSRRKEAEDESMAFLFEAVRTLRDRDPSTFTEKFAALNHLFEKSPMTNESECLSKSFAKKKHLIRKNSGLCNMGELVNEIAEESNLPCAASSNFNSATVPKVTDAVLRPRGRPKGSNKRLSSTSTDLHQTNGDEKTSSGRESANLLSTSVNIDQSLSPQRPIRKRASSGFYRALNSMAVSNGYQLASQKSKGFSLLY